MADGASTSGPTAGWASGPLGAVQAADREIARQTAARARAVAAFAATRPASADRPAGQAGSMSEERRAARPAVLAQVSEWAAQELVLALEISDAAAGTLLERSLTLVHRLPRTLAALESGALHVGHLFPMLERVAPIADDEKRAEVEAKLLDWAAGRLTTPAQLAAKARRSGLLVDARDSARRLAAAIRERGVFARPDRRDGMAQAVALLTVPEAAALVDALGRYADALDEAGDERTRGQKMADCLLDLVLRPGETDLAPVQAHVTVVASASTLAGGDEPGEVAGQIVPAEMVRALARALGLLPPTPVADPATKIDDVNAVAAFSPHEKSPVEQALEDWWNEVERRARVEGWGDDGAPPPEQPGRSRAVARCQPGPSTTLVPAASQPKRAALPLEYEPVRHAGRRRWHALTGAVDPARRIESTESAEVTPQSPESAKVTARSPEAAAEEAVSAAGIALLEFDRAVGRAGAAVRRAELAATADEAAWQDSTAGRVSAAADTIEAMRAAGDEQRAALARLLDATAGGGLAERPRIAVVDALTGALLALTDSRQLRRTATCGRAACRRLPGLCTHDLSDRPGLGPPPPTAGYRPCPVLERYLRARDRRCRFPGCRRPVPRGGELDHDRPWPDGPTSADNLVGYCTPHHRGKHQAPGWRHRLSADGTLTVTAPSGLRASTDPPPF